MRKPIATEQAPGAVGPYSQAVEAQGMVWASGQVGLDPATGELVSDDVVEQARQVMKNLAAVLEAAGSGFDRVLKCTVYLTDLGDFNAVNAVYAEAFATPYPARVCVEVSRLPKDGKVEVDAVATVG